MTANRITSSKVIDAKTMITTKIGDARVLLLSLVGLEPADVAVFDGAALAGTVKLVGRSRIC